MTIADTAGLREAADHIEREGIRRALGRADTADLRLLVLDAAAGDRLWRPPEVLKPGDLVIFNKIDAASDAVVPDDLEGCAVIPLSVKTGQNMDDLLEALATRVSARMDGDGNAPLTRERHRRALEDCCDALSRAPDAHLPELMAEDVRLAARALGRITGRVDVEEVLDVLFREFCIGK